MQELWPCDSALGGLSSLLTAREENQPLPSVESHGYVLLCYEPQKEFRD